MTCLRIQPVTPEIHVAMPPLNPYKISYPAHNQLTTHLLRSLKTQFRINLETDDDNGSESNIQ